ncbi:MAG: hypothetical protein ACK53W_12610 [Gemmatimonadota bacterium]
MDLSKLDTVAAADEGAIMDVLHPITQERLVDPETGEAVSLRLAGIDSERYRAHVRRSTNRRIQNRSRKVTAEDIEAEALDLLVAVTLGWTGIDLDGKPLPYSAANAKTLYTRCPWMREQADVFVGDRANFFRN